MTSQSSIRRDDVEIAVQAVSDWLRSRCGIDYKTHKHSLLQARLERVVDRLGLDSMAELSSRLRSGDDAALANAVMQVASTNHTFFFREPRVLKQFPKVIFPRLQKQSSIRIWSAASSTGDEAYSVAIMAFEYFGTDALERVSILGTDISEKVLQTAERGTYEGPQIQQIPHELRERYFRRSGEDALTVSDAIKSMCTFRRLNLKSAPWPFKQQFDVVLCRNVLYYFDSSDQRAVLENIYDVTAPGGWLLTSVTESIRDLNTRWQSISSGAYRSQG
jgi:chemotaxis protein methyltransferase CheR